MPRKLRYLTLSVLLPLIAWISLSFAPVQRKQASEDKSSQRRYAKYIFYDIKPVPAEMSEVLS